MHVSVFTTAVVLVAVPLTVTGQDMAQVDADRSIVVTPRVSLNSKFTDNIDLDSLHKRSELTAEVSPGIRIAVDGARVKTYLDYAFTQIAYANGSAPSHSQNALNAFGSIEAVDNLAFLDFSGSISQQTISAFGVQSVDDTAVNANRTEVATYRVSPYLLGQFGDWAQYEARYSRTVTDTDSVEASGSTVTDSVIRLKSGKSTRDLGWIADMGRHSASFSRGRATESDSINVGLTYSVSPQLQLLARAGTDNNNYTTVDKSRYATHAVRVNWLPSELTTMSLTRSRQSFGDAYDIQVAHRSGRTVWKLSDVKDLSTVANPATVGSMYELLFAQFASAEPDPKARAVMVENYLLTNGISPTASATNGFLTSAVTLQRRQELSFALLGVRDTVTFIASRSESSRLDSVSSSVDDLTNYGNVRQQGLSVQLAHRLTPDHSLGILLSQQQSSSANGLLDTRLRSLDVIVSGKLGKRSSMSVGARRTVMDSDTAPYTENAVSGNISVQF
jgi:uncharacterized protein (PEP-CTERM system associated)